jgi:ribonucleoside-diphosphate reductase alpha chain
MGINTVEDWLGKDNTLGIDIMKNKYMKKNEEFLQWVDRVSGNDEDLKKVILEKKFLFGGRTLSNRGTGNGSSYSNCYSSGYAPDDTSELMDLAKNIALTYKSEGGQGISLSKIRPKGSPIGEHGFESDGVVPFMEIFNQVTASISQGASRKGALILSLSGNHPDIKEFITIKENGDKINKANLSVELDDLFMLTVQQDLEDESKTKIDKDFTLENGKKFKYSFYPIEIYKIIVEKAWLSADPGVIFTNRFRNYNMMQYFDDYEIITGNPLTF